MGVPVWEGNAREGEAQPHHATRTTGGVVNLEQLGRRSGLYSLAALQDLGIDEEVAISIRRRGGEKHSAERQRSVVNSISECANTVTSLSQDLRETL